MIGLDFDWQTNEFMLYCRTSQLREKSMMAYEQSLKLFQRWCMEEMGIFTVDKVTENVIRRYIMELQERGKYTFYIVDKQKKTNYPERRRDCRKPISTATINNYIRNIRVFFNWLERNYVRNEKDTKLLAEGKYDEAVAAYEELAEYGRRQQALQQYVDTALEAGNLDLAAEIYERMGERDKKRELLAGKAEKEAEQGNMESAVSEMAELLCSPEGAKALLENEELYDALFVPGRAVQLEIGGTWYIAAVEEDRILVVQRYENQDFLRESTDVITWKDSLLRENLQFLRSFMQPLRSAILLTRNKNLTNDHGVIIPGEDTDDYVFVLTEEEMVQYPGPVAEHFAGESYWIRTPVEGSTCDGYTAEISLDENGAVKVSLSVQTLTLSHPVLAAMWVDTKVLLQGWAEF